jgi:hypothetical protein
VTPSTRAASHGQHAAEFSGVSPGHGQTPSKLRKAGLAWCGIMTTPSSRIPTATTPRVSEDRVNGARTKDAAPPPSPKSFNGFSEITSFLWSVADLRGNPDRGRASDPHAGGEWMRELVKLRHAVKLSRRELEGGLHAGEHPPAQGGARADAPEREDRPVRRRRARRTWGAKRVWRASLLWPPLRRSSAPPS